MIRAEITSDPLNDYDYIEFYFDHGNDCVKVNKLLSAMDPEQVVDDVDSGPIWRASDRPQLMARLRVKRIKA